MKKLNIRILLAISALVFSIIACEQAGNVITDAQATQTAIPTATVVILQLDNAVFDVGDDVVIIGGIMCGVGVVFMVSISTLGCFSGIVRTTLGCLLSCVVVRVNCLNMLLKSSIAFNCSFPGH